MDYSAEQPKVLLFSNKTFGEASHSSVEQAKSKINELAIKAKKEQIAFDSRTTTKNMTEKEIYKRLD